MTKATLKDIVWKDLSHCHSSAGFDENRCVRLMAQKDAPQKWCGVVMMTLNDCNLPLFHTAPCKTREEAKAAAEELASKILTQICEVMDIQEDKECSSFV